MVLRLWAYYYNNSWYRASDNFQLATSFDSLAWYDASKDSTLEISSSLVSKWNDQSPNGYDLEVLTVGRNFPQNTRLINGLTALEFVDDGTPANRTSAENASFLTINPQKPFMLLLFFILITLLDLKIFT